ncbi:MAG: hypothetical protein LBI03_09200 [Clostridiales bacterium]|jgi:polyhydroxyalkanoate synthesis regulator phasin|nr:hypothetical protein [Clostridiales bacterium]
MDNRIFSQEEVNRIVVARISREREKLTKEFDNKLRRRITSIQRTLQELCVTQQDAAAETKNSLDRTTLQNETVQPNPLNKKQHKGGEGQ